MRKRATSSRNRVLRPLFVEILENRSPPTDVRSLGSALPQLVPYSPAATVAVALAVRQTLDVGPARTPMGTSLLTN